MSPPVRVRHVQNVQDAKNVRIRTDEQKRTQTFRVPSAGFPVDSRIEPVDKILTNSKLKTW